MVILFRKRGITLLKVKILPLVFLLILGLNYPQKSYAYENIEDRSIYLKTIKSFQDELVALGVTSYGEDAEISGLYFSIEERDDFQDNVEKLLELLRKNGVDCEIRIESFPKALKENFIEIRFEIDENEVNFIVFNDERVLFENREPYIDLQGNIQIPIRLLENIFSTNIIWNEAENRIFIEKFELDIYPNKGYIEKSNAQIIKTDFCNINGSIYMPLRTLGECFDGSVSWNPQYRYATLYWHS